MQQLARVLLVLCILGGTYAVYILAMPVYWHIIGSSPRIRGPTFDSRKQLYEELQKTGDHIAGIGGRCRRPPAP